MGIGVLELKVGQPVVPQVVANEFRGVLARSQGDVARVVRNIINAVRHQSPFGKSGKIVVVHFLPFDAIGAAFSVKIAQQLLVFRVDAQLRKLVSGKDFSGCGYALKLLVPTFNSLSFNNLRFL